MKQILFCLLGGTLLTIVACENFNNRPEVQIPDFNFPSTIAFEPTLSAYNIFQGTASDLVPADDYHFLEMSSILFTDYAKKQRLVKVPAGTQMERMSDGSINFPDGTILVKTFYYYADERDTSLGKRIIESRLLIKESDTWNVATYLWNDTQTDATLELNGFDTQVSWINASGSSISTMYHVPDENECISCHQSNNNMIPLGTTLRNLNHTVDRNGANLNQINHLQSVGIMNDFEVNLVPAIVDYNDLNHSLEDRARAYLDLNCAHCHNPDAWEESTRQNIDLRYETPLSQTGLLEEGNRVLDLVQEGEMPFIGTTILDEEGVNMIVEYIRGF